MATDSTGVEELISWVDPNFVRFCHIHKICFDSDPVAYRDAGRCCPKGGERLVGYLARFRDDQGLPVDDGSDVWDDGASW